MRQGGEEVPSKEKELFHKEEVPESMIDPWEKPIFIVKRRDSYELHFKNRVEFMTLTGKYLGWSEVEVVE